MRGFCLLGIILPVACVWAGWFDTGDLLMMRQRTESAYRVYCELDGVEGVPRDGLLFRLADCEQEMNDGEQAVIHYRQLLAGYPHSPYALEARFKLVATDLLSPDLSVRRKAVGEMLEFCYGKDRDAALAEEAALAAATACYNSTWYREAQQIAARMLRLRPVGGCAAALLRLERWSAYLGDDLAAVMRLCRGSEDDEAVYLRAAVALTEGRDDEAKEGFYVYLADQTNGQYRAMAQEALAKIHLEEAAAAEKCGRADEAVAIYDRVVEEFPGDMAEEALFRKATVRFGQGRWTDVDSTLGALLTANAATPRRGSALYLQGVAQWKTGNAAAASNLVAKALSSDLAADYASEARFFLEYLTTNKTECAHHD